MSDIRIPNTEKLDRYFQLVQQEAAKFNAVYFAENISNEENIGKEDEFYVAELDGWLIPNSKASQFESVWKNAPVLTFSQFPKWVDYIRSAEWKKENGEIYIEFWNSPSQSCNVQGGIHRLDGTLEEEMKSIDEFLKSFTKQEVPLE